MPVRKQYVTHTREVTLLKHYIAFTVVYIQQIYELINIAHQTLVSVLTLNSLCFLCRRVSAGQNMRLPLTKNVYEKSRIKWDWHRLVSGPRYCLLPGIREDCERQNGKENG